MNPVIETEDMRQSPAAQSFGTFRGISAVKSLSSFSRRMMVAFIKAYRYWFFTVTAGFLQILSKLFSLCVGILPKTWFLARDEAEFVAHFKM